MFKFRKRKATDDQEHGSESRASKRPTSGDRKVKVKTPITMFRAAVNKALGNFTKTLDIKLEKSSHNAWLVRNGRNDWKTNLQDPVFRNLATIPHEIRTHTHITRSTPEFRALEAPAFFLKHNPDAKQTMGALVQHWTNNPQSPNDFFLAEWKRFVTYVEECLIACPHGSFDGGVLASNVIAQVSSRTFVDLTDHDPGSDSAWKIINVAKAHGAVTPQTFPMFVLDIPDRKACVNKLRELIAQDGTPAAPDVVHQRFKVLWSSKTRILHAHARSIHDACRRDLVTSSVLHQADTVLTSVDRKSQISLDDIVQNVREHMRIKVQRWCVSVYNGNRPQRTATSTDHRRAAIDASVLPPLAAHATAAFLTRAQCQLLFFYRRHRDFSRALDGVSFLQTVKVDDVDLLRSCIEMRNTSDCPEGWFSALEDAMFAQAEDQIHKGVFRAISKQPRASPRDVYVRSGSDAIVGQGFKAIRDKARAFVSSELRAWDQGWKAAAKQICALRSELTRHVVDFVGKLKPRVRPIWDGGDRGWKTPQELWKEVVGAAPIPRIVICQDSKMLHLKESKEWTEVDQFWKQTQAQASVRTWCVSATNGLSIVGPAFASLYVVPSMTAWLEWCNAQPCSQLSPIVPARCWMDAAALSLTEEPMSVLGMWNAIQGREFASAWLQ